MRITASRLRARGVGDSQVNIFRSEWPDGCEVTYATVRRAIEINISIELWAKSLLMPDAQRAFVDAVDRQHQAFVCAVREARRVYGAVAAAAWRVHEATTEPVRVDYHAGLPQVWDVHKDVVLNARRVYEESVAGAWQVFCVAELQERLAFDDARAKAFVAACGCDDVPQESRKRCW